MLEIIERYGYMPIIQKKRGSVGMANGNTILKEIVVGVISTLVASAIAAMVGIVISQKVVEAKMESLGTSVSAANENIQKLLDLEMKHSGSIESHEALINILMGQAKANDEEVKKVVFNNMDFVEQVFVIEQEASPYSEWERDEVIAVDIETNKEYTVGELQNTPILTYYLEGDSIVYFCGQYNENNFWNGMCTLNVYKNNELVSSFEGLFDNGTLRKYRRVACDNGKEWTFMDRNSNKDEKGNEYTSGETWNYEKNKSFTQEINEDNLELKNFLTVDYVLNNIDKKITSYYKGNTSNGYYNDDSGNAYSVRYNESGDVRYLYHGKIKDGQADDSTGKAWSINLLEKGGNYNYYYYEGNFSAGERAYTPDVWEPMTLEEINEKVKKEDLNCPLTGLLPS